jgi:hypothetical protein
MYAALTVVTHPVRRMLRALLQARRAARAARACPEVLFARAMQTGTFRTDMRLPYTPGRVAVMLWAHEAAALDEVGARVLAPLDDGAAERWHVLLRAVSVHGAWSGFAPDCGAAPPLHADEPTVVMIHSVLKRRHTLKFVRDNAAVGRQLRTAEGYLGGLALADTSLTTCSLSCWRRVRDSRAFAFGTGTHRDAYKIDQAEGRHSAEFFARFRPVRSAGTFERGDPLAGVGPPAAATPAPRS